MNEVLASIEALWERRPTDSDELLDLRKKMHEMDTELDDLRAAKKTLTHGWDIERKVAKNLAERLAEAMRNLTTQERELAEKYRELQKGYYEKVQKLVEGRVNEGNAKLADRLNNAEAKVLRYDKMDAPRKARVAAEAFPPLSAPISSAQKVVPQAWKSLRLVDLPKKQAP
jgi:seryl-tRNA synthetase